MKSERERGTIKKGGLDAATPIFSSHARRSTNSASLFCVRTHTHTYIHTLIHGGTFGLALSEVYISLCARSVYKAEAATLYELSLRHTKSQCVCVCAWMRFATCGRGRRRYGGRGNFYFFPRSWKIDRTKKLRDKNKPALVFITKLDMTNVLKINFITLLQATYI